METVFYPICQADGCVIHRPSSLGDLLSHIYEANMPRNAEYVFHLSQDQGWRFSCEVHKPVGKHIFRISDVQHEPEKFKSNPIPDGVSRWPAAWAAIVEPMVMYT